MISIGHVCRYQQPPPIKILFLRLCQLRKAQRFNDGINLRASRTGAGPNPAQTSKSSHWQLYIMTDA
jgi:hypothetical protein